MDIITKLKNFVLDSTFLQPEAGVQHTIEKYDETLTPNMRALRLAMSVGDHLLSMGVAASDVVSMMFDVTDCYCRRKVQIEVNSSVLMMSQDRGNDREPLTLIRAVSRREVNNMTVQSLQELVRHIHKGMRSLDEAEKNLDLILAKQRKYPPVITLVGTASISAGMATLYTGSTAIIFLTFLVGVIVTLLIRSFARYRIPSFYAQVLASTLITVIAAMVAWAGNNDIIAGLAGVNPTVIVIGGIVMLFAGLTVVGAAQDAIDEYYLTANAKLLKVIMMTIGIVVGVLFGLYIARRLGIDVTVSPDHIELRDVASQYVGATIVAAGYALSSHSRLIGVVVAGLLGWLALFIFFFFISSDFTAEVASGIAAFIVGTFAMLSSRVFRVPSTAMVASGIIPLVPGLYLYNGLMEIVNAQDDGRSLDSGFFILVSAIFIAFSIAVGASAGSLIGRPLRRSLIQTRNKLPRQVLSAAQSAKKSSVTVMTKSGKIKPRRKTINESR